MSFIINMETLIIYDWDDTLFPTTYILKYNIDPTNKLFFIKLDNILYLLLKSSLHNGRVVVVTNAESKWVYTTLESLPYTRRLIRYFIPIISARELYHNQYPGSSTLWKKLVFEKLLEIYYNNHQIIKNIISIGDSYNEFHALTNLYNFRIKNLSNIKLKAIKFIHDPSYEILLDELTVINNTINIISQTNSYLDLEFKLK